MKLENAVLITGGSQRIGAYLATQFLQQTPYPVVLTYRTPKPQLEALTQAGALALQSDFCQPNAIDHLLTELHAKLASLRAVIHNASLWLDDSDADSFDQQFKVHVQAPFKLNHGLQSLLLASSEPMKDIISISDASLAKGHAQQMGYCASKAALQNLTASFAKRFAPDIKVNDIAPALIEFNTWDSEQYKAKRLQESLIPIEPGAQVVWQAVQYLMASPYTTGTILKLDGGRGVL